MKPAGKYGMGSRSYFHYTDLLAVVSGSSYACLDPLAILSEDQEGFKEDLEDGRFAEGEIPAEILGPHRSSCNVVVAFNRCRRSPIMLMKPLMAHLHRQSKRV